MIDEPSELCEIVELALLKKEMENIRKDLDTITTQLDNITRLFENTKAVLTAVQWIGGTIAAAWAVFVAVKDHLSIGFK